MTRFTVKFMSVLLLAGALSSCSSNSENMKYTLNYIPLEDEENDRYVFLGADGHIMDAFFDESPTLAVNGFFAVEEDNGMTLCRITDGGYEKVGGADSLSEVGLMNDGLIPVCRDYEHIQVLDESGGSVFTLDSINGVEVAGCYSYSCGILRVRLANGTYAYVDRQGKNLFGKTYDWCSDFDENVAVVNVEDNTYALVNNDGTEIFTFDSEDYEKIKFSPTYGRLAATDDDERIIIYDFEGRQVGIYPSKVYEVVVFCEESFVFMNDDYDCGLMSYDGKEMIRAKYEFLAPEGKYFLAMHEDDEEEIKMIDEQGNVLKTLDGEDFYPFRCAGFDFPTVIARPDDEVYLIDDYGDVIDQGALNYAFYEDLVEEDPTCVNSLYFPQDEVLATVMEWCGNGTGLPDGQNLFFYRDGGYCHPGDVGFIKNTPDISTFKSDKSTSIMLAQGVNYAVNFTVRFDEPIVRDAELNKTAWLSKMVIGVGFNDIFYSAAFFNVCKNRLIEQGCTVRYSKENDHILVSNDGKTLIMLEHGAKNDSFFISICQNNEGNMRIWIDALNNIHNKK